MSFIFRDYPSTSFYDGDLGYLVKAYKKLVEDYDAIKNDYNDIQHRYEQIQKDIENFPKEMQRLYEEAIANFNKSFNSFTVYVENRLTEFSDELDLFEDELKTRQVNFELRVNATIRDMDERYYKILSDMRKEISYFEYRMQLAWTNYRDSVNRIIDDIQRDITVRINASQNYVKLYADGKIMESEKRLMAVIDQWSKDFPPVLNPINGQTEPLNDVLRQIWEVHVDGITVKQLVDSNITVSDLVAKKIPVLDIVTKGYALLYWKKPWMMYSPFDGQYVKITDVVYKLASLHKIVIAVQTLVNYNLTVEKIANANFTAYDVSWKGGTIFGELAENG